MSSPVASSEGQREVDLENGGAVEWRPLERTTSAGVGGDGVPRDTHSIPGVSMYARQRYPSTFFKHGELVANKELFWEALNKFHTTLGTRLTKKGRKGRERAAEVKSFEESLEGPGQCAHIPADRFLFAFMNGLPVVVANLVSRRMPTLGGVSIDLHLLYVEVTNRGGLEQVIKDRKWREVTSIFNFPDAITSGSYMVRKYYVGLLYYFEQAYFFGKQGPLVPPQVWMPGPLKKTVYSSAKTYALSDGDQALQSIRKRKILPIQLMPAVIDPASSIGLVAQGAIKGKFDQGYLVTVTVGAEKLQGVLYHVPPAQKPSQHADVPNYGETAGAEVKTSRAAESKAGGSWRKRPRKEEILKRDPNAPRPNRTGYNFFFAEQCSKYKAMHPNVSGLELSRILGHAWNTLTEHEKLPYQEQGMKDKGRYMKELQEYRERLQSEEEEAAASADPVTASVQGHEPEEEEAVVDADDDIARNSACTTTPDSVEGIQTSEKTKVLPTSVSGSIQACTSVEERGSGSGTSSSKLGDTIHS